MGIHSAFLMQIVSGIEPNPYAPMVYVRLVNVNLTLIVTIRPQLVLTLNVLHPNVIPEMIVAAPNFLYSLALLVKMVHVCKDENVRHMLIAPNGPEILLIA